MYILIKTLTDGNYNQFPILPSNAWYFLSKRKKKTCIFSFEVYCIYYTAGIFVYEFVKRRQSCTFTQQYVTIRTRLRVSHIWIPSDLNRPSSFFTSREIDYPRHKDDDGLLSKILYIPKVVSIYSICWTAKCSDYRSGYREQKDINL